MGSLPELKTSFGGPKKCTNSSKRDLQRTKKHPLDLLRATPGTQTSFGEARPELKTSFGEPSDNKYEKHQNGATHVWWKMTLKASISEVQTMFKTQSKKHCDVHKFGSILIPRKGAKNNKHVIRKIFRKNIEIHSKPVAPDRKTCAMELEKTSNIM